MTTSNPFELRVNGEVVWKSDSDAMNVVKVTLRTARGEAGVVGSPADANWVDIIVEERDSEASTFLDIEEETRTREIFVKREATALKNRPAPEKKTEIKAETKSETKTAAKSESKDVDL